MKEVLKVLDSDVAFDITFDESPKDDRALSQNVALTLWIFQLILDELKAYLVVLHIDAILELVKEVVIGIQELD